MGLKGNRTEDASWRENVENVEIFSPTCFIWLTVVHNKYYQQLYTTSTINSYTQQVLSTVIHNKYYQQLYTISTIDSYTQ